jgi:hypothetical protein
MRWRRIILPAAIVATAWALIVVLGALPPSLNDFTAFAIAHATDAGNPQRRADYAAKLQDQFNASSRTQVSAEGSNRTMLRITNPIVAPATV